MRRKWRSYLYVPVFALLLATGGIFIWNTKSSTQGQTPGQVYYLDQYFETTAQETEAHKVDDKNVVVESKNEAVTAGNSEFVLRAVDDLVCVYRKDNDAEPYMDTGISLQELPESTRMEIINGKEILDEESLYFFLESYSS